LWTLSTKGKFAALAEPARARRADLRPPDGLVCGGTTVGQVIGCGFETRDEPERCACPFSVSVCFVSLDTPMSLIGTPCGRRI